MRIVIPMAGHSERFRQAGYEVPKPFMMMDHRPMIHWVADLFSPDDEFVFIAQKAHLADPDNRRILETATPNFEIVEIEPNDLGPVYTSLAADHIVADDEPTIVSYCDYYQVWNYRQFLMQVAEYDGALSIFKGSHPASFGSTFYAYLRCNEAGEMLEIKEKESFTDNRVEEPASSGVYYFRNWAMFRELAQDMLDRAETVKNEYYVSLLYRLMNERGGRITTFEVDKFICWGTPEDVEQYFFWSEYFSKDAIRLAKKGLAE